MSNLNHVSANLLDSERTISSNTVLKKYIIHSLSPVAYFFIEF